MKVSLYLTKAIRLKWQRKGENTEEKSENTFFWIAFQEVSKSRDYVEYIPNGNKAGFQMYMYLL